MSELAMTRALSFRHSIASLFIAGFIATIVFHQAVFSVWYLMGTVPNPPFNFARTAPFGVPAIWSLAFFGGLWGIAYGWVENKFPDGAMYWIAALIFGALGPTLVGRLIVAPLKGQPIVLDFSLWRGFLINGVWGLGTAALLRWRP
ncbi:MAG TPA: hypothetical protein VGB82_14895 [Alphaproteobacteria bacterium]